MAKDLANNDQNSKLTNWEPFTSREKLQEFLNSDNTDAILYQGINRIRKQLTDEIRKIRAGDSSTDNRSSAKGITKLETPILELFSKLVQYTSIIPPLRSTGTILIRSILKTYMRTLVKTNVLENKNFANLIFKGLIRDPFELVDEVLTKIYDYVIADKNINRTTKLLFFNHTVLGQCNPEPPESKNIIADVVHRFLLSICCSPGVGICFRDLGWYPANTPSTPSHNTEKSTIDKKTRVHNVILSSFINSLNPAEDFRQRELLLRILEACPELVQVLEKTNIHPVTPPKVNTVMENILPRVFGRSTLSKCLLNNSPLVNYETMITLCIAFQKLDKVFQAFSKVIDDLEDLDEGADRAPEDTRPSSLWREAISQTFEEMKRRVPDIQVFLKHLSRTLSDGQKISTPSMIDDANDEQIRNVMLREAVLKILKYYHKYLPEAVAESKFDISNFIPASLSQIHLGTQLNLLELLNVIPDFNFSIKSENRYLATFLSLYMCTPYSQIRSSTEGVLENLLSRSIIFQHDPCELSIWLESLPRILPEDKSVIEFEEQLSVVRFLDESIEIFLKDPFPYIDELGQIILRGASENSGGELIESGVMEVDNDTNTLLREKLSRAHGASGNPPLHYPFSPLLVALIRQYQKKKDDPNIDYVDIGDSKNPRRKGHWNVADYVGNIDTFFQHYATLKRSCLDIEPIEDGDTTMLNKEESKAKDLCQTILKDTNPTILETAKIKFLELMSNIPVSILNRHLMDLLNYCKNTLGWVKFEPIIRYLNYRLPSCGSLFELEDVKSILNEANPERSTKNCDTKMDLIDEESSQRFLIGSLLELFSFSDLLTNAMFHMDNPSIKEILRKALSSCPPNHLLLSARHLMLYVDCIFNNPLDENVSALKFCFDLLTELVTRVVNDSIIEAGFISDYIIELINASISEIIINPISSNIAKRRSSKTAKYLGEFREILLNKVSNVIKGIESGVIPLDALSENMGFTLSAFVSVLKASELSQILLPLVNMDISKIAACSSEEAAMSPYIIFLSRVLSAISHYNLRKVINEIILGKLNHIWQIHPSREMENILLRVVEVCLPPGLVKPIDSTDLRMMRSYLPPSWTKNFDKGLARDVLGNLNDTRSRILAVLLVIDSEIRLEFVSKVLETPTLLDPLAMDDILMIVSTFLKVVAMKSDLRFSWSSTATHDDQRLVFSLSEQYGCQFFHQIAVSQMLKAIPSEFSIATCAFLCLSPSLKLIGAIENLMVNGSSNNDMFNVDCLSVLDCYLERNHGDVDESNLKRFLSDLLHQSTLFMENDVFKRYDREILVSLFTRIDNLIRFIPRNVNLDANIIGEFIFVLLEKRLEEPIILKCVASLISSEYTKEHLLGPPLDRVVEAIINNSQFKSLTRIPNISKEAESSTLLTRITVCSLLNAIFRTSPAVCCKSSFLSSLLACYGASTSLADQMLLEIFMLYEKSNNSSIGPYAMIWGSGSIRPIDRRGLMGQKIVVESLDLIDPMKMMTSYTRFPIDKRLEVKVSVSGILSLPESERVTRAVYDPSFFLPIFASLFSYGNLLDCRKLIEINALGFIVVSLSSTVEDVRKAGYYLMDEFYVLLENANFREKKQVLLLLNSLKNSIVERRDGKPPQRLPTIITVFFAHALNIFTNPAHFMYPLINKFLLQRPLIDLEDIPMFYSLFHSSSDNHQKERVWILRLLSAGLKTDEARLGYNIRALLFVSRRQCFLQACDRGVPLSDKRDDVVWLLNYLDSILRIFYHLTLVSSPSKQIFTPYHVSCILQFLEHCELLVTPDVLAANLPFLPIHINHNRRPSQSDSLDELYVLDHDFVKVYRQIIRMLFELVVNNNIQDAELVDKIISRTFLLGVSSEARQWTIECLSMNLSN
ncbi:16777_t:CDS:10 [Acaulospora colombiana]|uniref:16777_t:CDS:1 n=1 Tax=Acaulospora colombiana TaxID=27376 RepID=A0ACA9K081_9GLOM|nr:16777_t:CDS:10 [Acaulospora colombiana]